MTKNQLDLTAVQLHVKARQKMPARGIERAKPWMGVAESRPEIRKLGGVAFEARAGLFELADDLLIGQGSWFNVRDAQLSRGSLPASQQSNDFRNAPIHDPEVVDHHKDRPKAAAVLHPTKPIDQHGAGGAFRAAPACQP